MSAPERPLLVSPAPTQQTFREPPAFGGGAGNPRKARQIERLAPKFETLRQALEARRAALQVDASGPAPEQVVVFETNGAVKDFYEIVAKTRGLEWLADEELRDLDPDEDFFVKDKPTKQVGAQLYLVMSNQEALEQLLSLWKSYCAGRLPKEFRAWRPVFAQLRDIRRWGVQDRLRETRVMDYWRDRVAAGYETVTIEIELWFRSSATRERAQGQISGHVSRMGGQVLSTCVVEPIAYHAILASLPIRAVEQILQNAEVELLQCDEVRLVRPTGQAGAPIFEDAAEQENQVVLAAPSATGEPVIALLDGLPLENHVRLASRLVVDDPDEWSGEYAAQCRCHGTAMASLLVHGDLSARLEPTARPIYVRPVLRPSKFDGKTETAPEDRSWLDLIQRAVHRIVQGDAGQRAAAPRVCVINLSIGDPYQPFIRAMSPLARLLDWLAWTYKVLFIVSAGNHPENIEISSASTDSTTRLFAALTDQHRHRRILSPAESINALTVGATHEDASGPYQARASDNHAFDLVSGLPSPISGLGRGFRRMVKPEVLNAGGRVVYKRIALENEATVKHEMVRAPRFPPGQRVAAPGAFQGDLAGTRYVSGTSNAAALTSRLAAELYDVLADLTDQPNAEQLAKVPISLWLKTLVVHGASWSQDAILALKKVLGNRSQENLTDELSGILGFGRVVRERVLGCADERATILACGTIGADERYVHSIPLPDSLNAHATWRRLTITMSWFSPINPLHQKYRRASLWFEPPGTKNALDIRRFGVDWRAVRRGTIQHEVLQGDRSAINIAPDATLEVPVSCVAEAGTLDERIPYAMAATVEIAPGTKTPIYDEVRARIAQRVPVRP